MGKLAKHRKIKWKNSHGFSMIEIIVVLAVFTTVMLAATGMFQNVIQSSRNNTVSLDVQESMRYSLEIMAKEMRNSNYAVGDNQDCTPAVSSDDKSVYSVATGTSVLILTTNGYGDTLFFKNKYKKCVKYYKTNNTIMAEKGDGISTSTQQLLPDSIVVNNLQFYLVQFPNGTSTVPSVSMVIDASTKEKGFSEQKIKIQTTITSRNYEMYN
jgi:prepilin-type N-terminal cleavage/methylation domain-containing protein